MPDKEAEELERGLAEVLSVLRPDHPTPLAVSNRRYCDRCAREYDKNDSPRICLNCAKSLAAESLKDRFRTVS